MFDLSGPPDEVDSYDEEVKPYSSDAVELALTFTESFYQTEGGKLPTPSDYKFLKTKGVDEDKILELLKSSEFREGLSRRGILWPKNYDGSVAEVINVLSPQQQHCILVVTDPTRDDNLRSRLAAVGVSYAVFRNWRKQPSFANALTVLAEDMLSDNIAGVHTAVVQKAMTGDTGAARLYYELTGRHDPAKQQMLDLGRIVGLILSSLQQHVTDPLVLKKLRDDMDKIMSGDTPEIEAPKADLTWIRDVVDAEIVTDEGETIKQPAPVSLREAIVNGFVSDMQQIQSDEDEAAKEAKRDEGNTPRGFFDV